MSMRRQPIRREHGTVGSGQYNMMAARDESPLSLHRNFDLMPHCIIKNQWADPASALRKMALPQTSARYDTQILCKSCGQANSGSIKHKKYEVSRQRRATLGLHSWNCELCKPKLLVTEAMLIGTVGRRRREEADRRGGN